MQNKLAGLFLILFSGLVVSCFSSICICNDAFAATPVPLKISSHKVREVRVYLKSQRFGYYEEGRLVFWGPVCSGAKQCMTRKGMKQCDTPKGNYRVLFKQASGYVSKEYKALMPYAIKFSVSGHFLHVGDVRSIPSSHGCVRLCEEDAKSIYLLVKLGDPVIVTD